MLVRWCHIVQKEPIKGCTDEFSSEFSLKLPPTPPFIIYFKIIVLSVAIGLASEACFRGYYLCQAVDQSCCENFCTSRSKLLKLTSEKVNLLKCSRFSSSCATPDSSFLFCGGKALVLGSRSMSTLSMLFTATSLLNLFLMELSLEFNSLHRHISHSGGNCVCM